MRKVKSIAGLVLGAILVIGVLTLRRISVDILPVFKSPAVQVLTFFGGMPAVGMEKSITNRMERGTGMADAGSSVIAAAGRCRRVARFWSDGS